MDALSDGLTCIAPSVGAIVFQSNHSNRSCPLWQKLPYLGSLIRQFFKLVHGAQVLEVSGMGDVNGQYYSVPRDATLLIDAVLLDGMPTLAPASGSVEDYPPGPSESRTTSA